MLRELFAALGNDPFVVAECLAKPVLAERLVADFSAQGKATRFESQPTETLRSYVDGDNVCKPHLYSSQ